jgi:hypothetical protein
MQLSADSQLLMRQGGDMAHSLVRTMLVSGAAVGLMASAGACSCSIGSSSHAVAKSDVASQITQKLTDAAGNKPDSVDCPGDLPATLGAQLNCSMKVKGVQGATLRCQLVTGGKTYGVNVSVTGVDAGTIDYHFVVDDQPSSP